MVLSVQRERGKVGNLLNNKDVVVVGWQHCENKHGILKFCRLRIVYVHTLVQYKPQRYTVTVRIGAMDCVLNTTVLSTAGRYVYKTREAFSVSKSS